MLPSPHARVDDNASCTAQLYLESVAQALYRRKTSLLLQRRHSSSVAAERTSNQPHFHHNDMLHAISSVEIGRFDAIEKKKKTSRRPATLFVGFTADCQWHTLPCVALWANSVLCR
mmetsp:Transcript_954/g.2669  ORF Transcript_954/g.2669 Transcript_954/m.2669 type:complete len:116 (+) Transcript_954:673-1020(+)